MTISKNVKPPTSHFFPLNIYSVISIVALITIIMISFLWNCLNERDQTIALAKKEALTNFNKDIAFRYWATEHGGVYVPTSDKTPPNPYLSRIQERDIATPSGRKLTLMNPAYMIRQVMEEYEKLSGVKGRITSLKFLNPKNAPDSWERQALTDFEKGVKEVFEVINVSEKPHLRLIRPLITKEGCLKCHRHQGYKVGDVRGGIGVSLPLSSYYKIEQQAIYRIIVYHGLFGFSGIFAIVLIARQSRKRIIARKLAEDEINKMNSELEQRIEERTAELEQEITEHITTESKLRESEALLTKMGKISRIGGWEVDLETMAPTWTDEVAKIYEVDEVPPVEEGIKFYSPESLPIIQDAYTKLLTDGDSYDLELQIVTAKGKYVWIRTMGTPIYNDVGNIIKATGILQDITERKKAVEALIKSEKKYRDLVDFLPIAMFEVGEKGILNFANRAFLEMFGYSEADVNKEFDIYKTTAPEDRDRAITTSSQVMKGARFGGQEYTALTKKGIKFPVNVFSTRVDYENKTIQLGIIIDVSIRKQAEEQIKASLKEKETLLQEIHHRVKNNLQVISSLLKLQANTVKDERITTVLTDSWNRIQAMSTIHEILYQSENLSSIDMNTYLSKLGRMVFQNYTIGSQVNLNIKVENVLIGVKRASPVGLIVNELVSNSLKYAFPDIDKAEITIGLEKAEQEHIELTYMDNGIGIPKDFDWYNTKSMGLNLVKILSEKQLGGSIKLNRDHGTCFVILFKQEKD